MRWLAEGYAVLTAREGGFEGAFLRGFFGGLRMSECVTDRFGGCCVVVVVYMGVSNLLCDIKVEDSSGLLKVHVYIYIFVWACVRLCMEAYKDIRNAIPELITAENTAIVAR